MRGIEDLKDRITITIDKELLDWLDEKIRQRVFANRSHGFEFLARKKMKIEFPEESNIRQASYETET